MSAELIHKAENYLKIGRPFVIYRRPGENMLNLLAQNDGRLHQSNQLSEKGFVVAPFDPKGTISLIRADELQTGELKIKTQQGFTKPKPLDSEQARQEHIHLVTKAVDQIKKGSLIKVVVSRSMQAAPPANALAVFQNLLLADSQAFCYLWHHPDLGLWMGATPELLLSVQDRQVKTYSLAGTKKAEQDKRPDWTDKEREEQAIVTKFLLNALADKGLKPVASQVVSVRAAKLWHLRTEIAASYEGSALEEIVDAIHPTPAVCGLPRKEALDFIRHHENYDRSFYSGYLGEINMGEQPGCSLYVNLRCMEIRDRKSHIYVGGGITAYSDPTAEWEEIQHKSLTVLQALFNSGK